MTRPARTSVVVIGGGENCEHDVSLASARSVAAALNPHRYDVCSLTIGRDGRWLDDAMAPLQGGVADALDRIAASDVVFPAVHGPGGEDGTVAGWCELTGIPYVGSGVRAGALAMDKWATKLVAEAIGVRTAAGTLVTSGSLNGAADGFIPPVVVKPVSAGSSHGVSRVDTREQLDAALRSALALDDRALVEEMVWGREIDVAVLEWPNRTRLVGPPLEVVVEDGAVFDTERKYDGSAEFVIPAELSDADRVALTASATALFDALGCAGVARFDFFLTSRGLVLNEVNTMPGMTEQSQVPQMFAAVGLPYPELLDVLIESALDRLPRTGSSQQLAPNRTAQRWPVDAEAGRGVVPLLSHVVESR